MDVLSVPREVPSNLVHRDDEHDAVSTRSATAHEPVL